MNLFTFDPAATTRYAQGVTANSSGFMGVGTSVWQNRTDQSFVNRGQLIAFQQNLQQTSPGAFPPNALQYLGTFSRELNAPSWGPTANASDLGGANTDANGRPSNYKTIRDADTSYNRLLSGVRFANGGTVQSYYVDGTAFSYSVNAGDPLVQRRFPLGRLAWIGPNGPQNGGTPDNIKACFGLQWDGAGAWNYVAASSTYSSPSTTSGEPTSAPYRIKTLGEIAKESPPREPNFFELLAAGILSGSLAMSAEDRSTYSTSTYYHEARQEAWPDLHVFRIGAAILTQAQTTDAATGKFYPVVVDYQRNGDDVKAVGTDSLPYLNMFTVLSGVDSASATPAMACYMLFSLWNPHQDNGTVARPPVRMCLQGTVCLANDYGTDGPVYVRAALHPGYILNIGASQPDGIEKIVLSDSGVNGFTDPHVLLGANPSNPSIVPDVQGSPGIGTDAGQQWATLPAIQGQYYVGYRLPNFHYDATRLGATYTPGTKPPPFGSYLWFFANTNALAPSEFNCWLEFQNASGNWIPYTYLAGIKHTTACIPATVWSGGSVPGFYAGYMGPTQSTTTPPVGQPASPKSIDPAAGTTNGDNNYYLHYPLFNSDPRTLRFNYTQGETTHSTPGWTNFLHSSVWSSVTEAQPTSGLIGRPGYQDVPTVFRPSGSTSWAPAGLARNNTLTAPATAVSFAAYADPDKVQRIADSGLYTNTAASTASSHWPGDPYALVADRKDASGINSVSDRPIMLHRPLNNVAELGYASRDYPWRTLDFFSAKSADSGLLDLFTASPNAGALSAGRINLNTRNLPALSAALNGTTANILTNSTMPSDRVSSIAFKLAAQTSQTTSSTDFVNNGPLINKDEIVTRLVPKLSQDTTISATSDFANLEDQNIKPRREAVTRALAEVGQTRTWNLLIDVVAQTGRYPAGATQLGKFNVEGERHYWLHVAIDRFTGKVIDQQLEVVAE